MVDYFFKYQNRSKKDDHDFEIVDRKINILSQKDWINLTENLLKNVDSIKEYDLIDIRLSILT